SVFDLGVPTMGICYGFQLMSVSLGGRVAKTDKREYGSTPLSVTDTGSLLAETPSDYKVWMSHGDSVAEAPAGCDVLASTPDTPVGASECPAKRFAGVQWHPEVVHSQDGQTILVHLLHH